MKRTQEDTKHYLNRKRIHLDAPLTQGREGTIHLIRSHPHLAAKLFRPDHPDPIAAAHKVHHLLSAPPPTTASRNFLIAWPTHPITATARTTTDNITGYAMPLLDQSLFHHIGSYFNPSRRRRMLAGRQRPYTFAHLVLMARNLALAAAALHRHHYLIGDLNSRNIMASDQGRIAVIDTDSFQATDPETNSTLLCTVGTPEYTPTRLQGKSFADQVRTSDDDNFALAVMIYQLLFQGSHPHAGTGADQDQTDLAQRIAHGLFAHAPKSSPTPQSALIWKDTPLKRQFNAAFASPSPPSALSWAAALTHAASRLRRCPRNPTHLHLAPRCTWCRYQQTTTVNPFPDAPTPPARKRKKAR